ncbi:hypothetical protein PybrP1_007126 [[Pythium] brassicae (nom. inval.)]|nr:hypothetical protein PybrP1_007126 [[Pythium] brassicae (nom. inval.)]
MGDRDERGGRGDRGDRGDRFGDRTGISLLVRNFERFGDVRDVYIPKDFYTREPKGFAFVEFKTERDANDARQGLDGVRIDGREVRVVFAQERRKTTDQMRDREKCVSRPQEQPLALGLPRPQYWQPAKRRALALP